MEGVMVALSSVQRLEFKYRCQYYVRRSCANVAILVVRVKQHTYVNKYSLNSKMI